MTNPSPPATARRPRWPWAILALGLLWTVLIRIPLILNAEDHLDSDLAVDGLTLLDALNGRWRWHYPGTPYMGIPPMLASYPQALLWGASPIALVSGGAVLWALVVASTFGLAWRSFGPAVASWAIVPLAFSSLGTIWLSGRITGGHLLAPAWHASAFLGLQIGLARGGWRPAAMLGLWCGLGVYNDGMGLVTIAGIVAAASFARLVGPRTRSGLVLASAFVGGLAVGLLPREIGRRVDPYDAYPSQFAAVFEPSVIAGHADLLASECLPRLVAGTGLRRVGRSVASITGVSGWLAALVVIGFLAAVARLSVEAARRGDPARRAVAAGTLLSAAMVVAAFLVNANIFNSDNYRYLIFLLTPWSLGFGLGLDDLYRLGWRVRVAAGLIAGSMAVGMTAAAFHWYRDVRHYVDDRGLPSRTPRPPWSELVVLSSGPEPAGSQPPRAERFAIPADATHVFGGYWDVYRLSFLSGKRLVGIPHPRYPNRFPGWSVGLGPGRGKMVVLRPSEESASSRPAAERPGGRPERVRSARAIDWRSPLATVWAADGRDPAELDRIEVVVP